MECRDVRQFAEACVTEQLLVETTQAIVAHLDECAACRTEVDGLRRLRAATRSAFEAAPDLAMRPEFAAGLRARLQSESARRETARTPLRGWIAMAASILLVAVSAWGWHDWSASAMAAMLHAAAGDHRFCAVTFRLTERPISLEESARRYGAVDGRLAAVEPSVPMLSGGPVRILERHSCVYEGRRFVHIVLRYRNELASLLVTDDPRSARGLWTARTRGDERISELPVTDGFHVVSFGRGPHTVFVVSSLSNEDLQEVTRAMLGPVSRALAGV